MRPSKKLYLPIVLIILAVILLTQLQLFSIKEVSFRSSDVSCLDNNSLSAELQVKGQKIWQLNKEAITKQIKDKYLCVREVSFSYRFPSRLEIFLSSRSPIARTISFHQNQTLLKDLNEASPSSSSALLDWSFGFASDSGYLVDEEGVIYDLNNDYTPLLYIDTCEQENCSVKNSEPIKIGDRIEVRISQRIKQAFDLLRSVGLNFTQAKILDGQLLIDSKPRVVLDLKGEILKQTASLQLILNKSKIDSVEAESIDLRFSKPVVIYPPKK